jgi:hypothetical protein
MWDDFNEPSAIFEDTTYWKSVKDNLYWNKLKDTTYLKSVEDNLKWNKKESEITDIMWDDEDKKINFQLEQTKLSGWELPYKAFERDTWMRWTPANVSKAAAHIKALGFVPAWKQWSPEFNISLTNAIKQVREQDPEMYNEMVARLSK